METHYAGWVLVMSKVHQPLCSPTSATHFVVIMRSKLVQLFTNGILGQSFNLCPIDAVVGGNGPGSKSTTTVSDSRTEDSGNLASYFSLFST